MEYSKIADQIIEKVGGGDNIASVTHCVTRLRLVLLDEEKADDAAVKKVEGVQSVVHAAGQYQVIIGQEVADVAAAVAEKLGKTLGEQVAGEEEDEGGLKVPNISGDGWFNKFIRVISSCIFPLVGLLIASGMLQGILTILKTAGLMQATDGAYVLLNSAASSTLYFLPILVGFIAGKTFGCNPYLTAVVGATMVYPDIVAAFTDGTKLSFFGIPIVLTKYAYQLFPILIAAWFTAKVEGFWKKLLPKVVALMCVPLLTLVIVVPCTFLVIGPVMTQVANLLAAGVSAIIAVSPTVAGAIMGAFWQLLIMLGVARAFSPIMMNNITTLGCDPIMAMTGMATFGLVGAGLGYLIKQHDKETRSEVATTTLTAFLGVTEPIIYTLALPQKTPFVASWVGGAVGGAIIGFTGATVKTYGGGGIFQSLLMVNESGTQDLVYWAVAATAAFAVSLIVALVICKDAHVEQA